MHCFRQGTIWMEGCMQSRKSSSNIPNLKSGWGYFLFALLNPWISSLKGFNFNRDTCNLLNFFQQVLREVKALASLQHGSIVGYNAAWLEYATNFGAECGMLITRTFSVITCILQTLWKQIRVLKRGYLINEFLYLLCIMISSKMTIQYW